MFQELHAAPPDMHEPQNDRSRWRVAAWALWVVPVLVIAILVAAAPEKRTVTHLYHDAVVRWWHRVGIYDGPRGMNYLPHFAVLFTPFHLPPRVVGDILWRAAAAAGLAAGLWLFCGAISGPDRRRAFVLVTLLTLPLSLPALRNGQANAHLGAALLLAAWCLKARRWWAATVLLYLATAIKPLGIAGIGLAWAAYPQLWWRLAVGMPILAAFPFLFGPRAYVSTQYLAFLENLRQAAEVTVHHFADLNGLLRTFGIPLSGMASLGVRALAGVLVMGLCWTASRRTAEPLRSLVWLSATASYLMLFNPMTEANSYVILAPALGLVAWGLMRAGEKKLGWLLAGMLLTMGLLPNLLRPFLGNAFALAWHPAMTLGFLSVVTWQVFGSGAPRPDPARAAVGPA